MRWITYSDTQRSTYPVCLLVPQINQNTKAAVAEAYFSTHLSKDDVIVIELFKTGKKTSAANMKQFITEELEPELKELGVQYILCADSEYFKILAKVQKTEVNLGYVMDSICGPKVLYTPSHGMIFYNPEATKTKIEQALYALGTHRIGLYTDPGTHIINFEAYPRTTAEIEQWLIKLLEMDCPLAIDIEGFSLKHYSAGIGTITFCWNQHEGIAFPVDYRPIPGATEAPYGEQVRNEPVRRLLKQFFKLYVQKAMYHSISYDVTVLIYQLFMKDLLDREGLLEGLDVMLRNWDDTKLITYLATNSCAGNDLSLKAQSQEYCGNYAMGEDIKDIRNIPLDKLLRYNLVDGLGTWYVYNKHWNTMVADDQLDIYDNLFKPSIIDIVDMQLTGMPVNYSRVLEVEQILLDDKNKAVTAIQGNRLIKEFTHKLHVDWVDWKNSVLKKKRVTLADVPADIVFNPNSDPQMQELFFTFLNLPVINLTKSKQPSTDGETIDALLNHTQDPEILDLLNNLKVFNVVGTLLTNFIPSLKGSVQGPDGWHYLFGNFNLGGTLSGRLSSSGPNLQNLPSTGKGKKLNAYYAKLIKTCFQAPPGWLFCGIDFASLEDRISALTTKDPNKLKVYTDGYDGHSLRAYAYFGDQMPDIDPNSVDSINSIQKKYKPLRDRSKNPTFTLTYQGTFHALMKKYAFPEDQAKDVEAKYHDLYKVSDDWVAEKLEGAARDGYITGAFGLRLRTPLLRQVVRGNSKTPYEAEKEGRTAGNALGQSWCLLNSRAGNEFNTRARSSEHRLDIRPSAQIHDAQYHLIRDDIACLMYANKYLVKAVQWQEHPDIQHDEVKLGGEFSIFYPNWSKELSIPNDASEEVFYEKIAVHMAELKAA